MKPQISDRNEGTLREIVAVPKIEGGMKANSWESRDVCPAVEDSVLEAVSRPGKIRGAKGETGKARNAMVIAMGSQIKNRIRSSICFNENLLCRLKLFSSLFLVVVDVVQNSIGGSFNKSSMCFPEIILVD